MTVGNLKRKNNKPVGQKFDNVTQIISKIKVEHISQKGENFGRILTSMRETQCFMWHKYASPTKKKM